MPWLPACTISRSGGRNREGIRLLLAGLRPATYTQTCPLPPPKLPAKTTETQACRSSHKALVLVPLGLCLGRDPFPLPGRATTRAVCGWEPHLACGPACQQSSHSQWAVMTQAALEPPRQQTTLRLKWLGQEHLQRGHHGLQCGRGWMWGGDRG